MFIKKISKFIRDLDPYQTAALEKDGLRPIQLEEMPIKRKFSRVMVTAFIFFFVWSIWAPLDDGVLVPGTVVVKGNRKAVQHPSGGVVDKILVKEGSKVKQGDELIQLNSLNIDSDLNTAELENYTAMAVLSRLQSEKARQSKIAWMEKMLVHEGDPRLNEAKRLQTELFTSRTFELVGQQKILREQITGLEAVLKGLNEAILERRYQIKMATEEAKNAAELAAEGFVPRVQAAQAERVRSDMMAGIATAMAEQAKTLTSIAAARLQLIQLTSTYNRDIDTQMSDTQKAQQALEAKVDSLKFSRNLISIRAPVDGTVVGLKANTIGGVIGGGALLMEVVPNSGSLVIDAQVPPQYIDKMAVGMQVDLRFSAFNRITTPVIPGTVSLVGADKQTATSTTATALAAQGTDFYLVQIETTSEDVKLLGDHPIQPGMPVEVIFKTGKRSFASLLVKPISDRMSRAFKD